jgi:1,6-anhydro-N-acetylmuramate kinase
MSGTSLNSVDVTLIETDGERIDALGRPANGRRFAPQGGVVVRR